MNRMPILLCAILVVAAFPVVAYGQSSEGEDLTPEQVELGEIQVKFMNLDFVSVSLDGESWDETEYTADGRKVSLMKVNRTVGHTVHLTPRVPGYDEVDIVVEPADWKLVKVSKQVRAWKVEKTASFKKKPAEPKKVDPPAAEEPGEVPPVEPTAPAAQ